MTVIRFPLIIFLSTLMNPLDLHMRSPFNELIFAQLVLLSLWSDLVFKEINNSFGIWTVIKTVEKQFQLDFSKNSDNASKTSNQFNLSQTIRAEKIHWLAIINLCRFFLHMLCICYSIVLLSRPQSISKLFA